MDVNKIQSADILDIIFDGRNKEYGAYELRKTYNKRMTKALVGTVLILLLAVLGNILANTVGKESKELIVQDVSLENVQQEEKSLSHHRHLHHQNKNLLKWKSLSSLLLKL